MKEARNSGLFLFLNDFSALPRAGLLFFACPKKSNQKKRHPMVAPFGFPALLDKPGATQLARCSALSRAQTDARYTPGLSCDARHAQWDLKHLRLTTLSTRAESPLTKPRRTGKFREITQSCLRPFVGASRKASRRVALNLRDEG